MRIKWAYAYVGEGWGGAERIGILIRKNTVFISKTGRSSLESGINMANSTLWKLCLEKLHLVEWNLSGTSPSGKTIGSVWKDHFSVCENLYLPLNSMETEHVWNDHLSGKTTFNWHLRWSVQTGFTVISISCLEHGGGLSVIIWTLFNSSENLSPELKGLKWNWCLPSWCVLSCTNNEFH